MIFAKIRMKFSVNFLKYRDLQNYKQNICEIEL